MRIRLLLNKIKESSRYSSLRDLNISNVSSFLFLFNLLILIVGGYNGSLFAADSENCLYKEVGYFDKYGVTIKIDANISGIITDSITGVPLSGVTIRIENTNSGAITDESGNFELKVIGEKEYLIVSTIGYETKRIRISPDVTYYNISLVKSSSELNELEVVGYGTQKKATVTGAIESVGTKDLVRNPGSSVANTLAGKVTGISTVQRSGEPGASDPEIFVRGVGTLNSGSAHPLILVDGVERSFNQIDPNAIESVTVLKDASATAVYGVRGANGVILITTRRGKKGPAQINVTTSVGFQQPIVLPKFADAGTTAKLYAEAEINDGNELTKFPESIQELLTNQSQPVIYPNTDFVDYVTKKRSFQTKSNINISGGTDDVRYFVSLGYMKEDGSFRTFGLADDFNYVYNRYNYQGNLDIDVTKSTKISFTTGGRSEVRNKPDQAEPQFTIWRNIYFSQPYRGVGIVDGKHIMTDPRYIPGETRDALNGYWGRGFHNNVTNILNLDLELNQDLDFLTKGLSFKIKGSYNTNVVFDKLRRSSQPTYYANYIFDVDPNADPNDSTIVLKKDGGTDILGYAESFGGGRDWYAEASFSYNRSFDLHNITGLVLYNESKTYYPSQNVSIPRGYVGLVGRVTYDYNSKYLFEADLGYNGSENFAEGKRFGVFPAVSLGWLASEESFFNDIGAVNFLKLRGSIGWVGNDQYSGGRFLYLPDSWIANAGSYSFGNNVPQGQFIAAENRIGNPNVSWETSRKIDFGIDVRVLNDKLSFTGDYFLEHRKDILTNPQTVPILLSINLPIRNIGIVDNHGYELKLEWRDKIGLFNYAIEPNLTFAKNKIIYADEIPKNEPYLEQTGRSVNQAFGYVFDGFWTEEDLSHFKDFPDAHYNAGPGDMRYKDLNNDGVIDSDDRMAIGYPEYPAYVFGLNLDLEFKGIYLNMQWAGAKDVSRQLAGSFLLPFGPTHSFGLMDYFSNRWTPETQDQNNLFPRMTFVGIQNNSRFSDFWLRDASYLRLKVAEIGYDFGINNNLFGKIGLKGLTMFLRGYNLLTYSKLLKLHIDPESRPTEGALYPIMKVYNFGFTFNF